MSTPVIDVSAYKALAAVTYYNLETGDMLRYVKYSDSWKKTGTPDKKGYKRIGYRRDGKTKHVAAHRLAWFIMTGEVPENIIHHIDGDPTNNSWRNLEHTTQEDNLSKEKRSPTTFHKGTSIYQYVKYVPNRDAWRARVSYGGHHPSTNLGDFDTEIDAAWAVYDWFMDDEKITEFLENFEKI